MLKGNLCRLAVACAMMTMLATVGCGGGAATPQPVSGTVSVKGGKPLTKGAIRFTTAGAGKKVSAVGQIDGQGNFKLTSLTPDDGALPGEYTVTLAGTETGQDYEHPNDPIVKVVDDKYNQDTTTDLRYTVKPGKNVCKFEVDPAK